MTTTTEVQIIPADWKEAWQHIGRYFSRLGAVIAKEGTTCVYRNQNGDKCAVGCLLTDETYFKYPKYVEDLVDEWGDYDEGEGSGAWFEGEDVTTLLQDEYLRSIVDGDNEDGERKLEFLKAAQKLHDNVAQTASHFVTLLDGLAFGFGLEVQEYTREKAQRQELRKGLGT